MVTTVVIVLAAGVLALLAVVMAYALGWANRRFHVATDPDVEAALAALPGTNCGACGYAGCAEYAQAIARGNADITRCAPGGTASARELADIIGVEVPESFPYRAVLHCSADDSQRLQRAEYRGEPTCAAANLVAGVQGCTYGCLGFGDCARACPYGAIAMVNGLATIDYQQCVGCRACGRACPRNIISMVPFKAESMLVVACSNHDSGADVRSVCTVGCIGCKVCSRMAPEMISMRGALPVVDYDLYDPQAAALRSVLEECPRKRLVFVGRPSAQDLAAAAGEELPEEIQADFKTTVDETEWRG